VKNKLILIYVFVALLTGNVFSQSNNENSRKKFDPAADPFEDLKTVIAEAQKVNKRIILDVGGEWCSWCHRVDEFIEQSAEIKNYMNEKYIVLKVNYSEENKNEKFLSQYPKIDGYPHFFVLSKKGKFLHSQNTGKLEKEKSYDLEKFMKFLRKWAAKK